MAEPVRVRRLTDQEGQKLKQVVRRGSTSSLATVLAAALCGRRVHWILGARPLPDEAHAWVSVEGGGALGLDGPDQNNPVRPWVPVITTPSPVRANQ
ncbi:lasso peptide biosynthesis protein [Streptomyces sp. NPDC057539]|uniref:lasso peptide biosynthesis protein n=1 Tax=Streptomyces sp. NPDC057539 TaxID=3346159 RepID=UPI00367781F4